MWKRSLLAVTVGGLMLATGTPAKAAFGTFDFSSAVTTPASANNPIGINTAEGGDATLQFLTNSGSGIDATLPGGGADITFGQIQFNPGSVSTSAFSFTVPFTYTVTLTDEDSTETGTYTVSGSITGNAKGGGSSSAINSTVTLFAPMPGSQVIGTTPYSLASVSPTPGPGSSNTTGDLHLLVSTVPEPASLALLGLGGLGALVLVRRRARPA